MSTSDFHSYFTEKCGLKNGDILYLSANIIRLAKLAKKKQTQFDPAHFIFSIKEKIGNEGTLLIPAFNHDLRSKSVFDTKRTAPITGVLAQTAMKLTEFRRTFNALHSFFVFGKYQEEICAFKNTSSFSEESPFGFLRRNQGKMLIIDLDLQSSLTFAHHTEELLQVSYRKWKSIPITYHNDEGNIQTINFRLFAKKNGYINEVNPMLPILVSQGAAQQLSIEGIPVIILDLPKVHELLAADLRNNKGRNIVYFSLKQGIKSKIKQLLGRE
jgi:aminoglycoside 3-N-acetyltransferase